MTTNFKVGQKVVCVDDSYLGKYANEIFEDIGEKINIPILGQKYTIRDVDDNSVLLAEINNKKYNWEYDDSFGEPRFLSFRFRPLTYQSCSKALASTTLTIETSDMPITNPSPKPEKELI